MTRKKTQNKTIAKTSKRSSHRDAELPTTLMGHLNELKTRLFWVVIFFVIATASVYPFFTQIVKILTAPLDGIELHYFSPAGGLSFIIKICMYLGVIGALPALVYHMYKFVQPVMSVQRTRRLIGYTAASLILAICGILFTYNIILPAAVGFLTSFEIADVAPVLSVDSYMSFVIAYVVSGALLFQLPLVMLLINTITPLSPSKLLSYERHVIVGSFVVAAILSPTPDVVNQLLLAMPLVVMYQIGFLLVYLRNKAGKRTPAASRDGQAESAPTQAQPSRATAVSVPAVIPRAQASAPIDVRPAATTVSKKMDVVAQRSASRPSIDGVVRRRPVDRTPPILKRPTARSISDPRRSVVARQRSVDGFSTYSYSS